MNISIPIDKRYIYENLTSNEIPKGTENANIEKRIFNKTEFIINSNIL